MLNDLFLKAVPLLKAIEARGFEAVFVGGSVRDYILGRDIHDVDIATSALPEEVKAIFPSTIDIGIQHGTVMVLYGGDSYEITTYRTEGEYSDFRKPNEVTFIRSLKEDLKRRDFTMNSMALDKAGELYDPFGGKKAILEKRIDTVGKASERFSEDALRMLRALRFASQLSFSCSGEIVHSLKENHALLDHISVERITSEFEKLIDGRNAIQAFKLLIETDLYMHLPGFAKKKEALISASQIPFHHLSTVNEKWAILLYKMVQSDEVESLLRQWKLPVKQIRTIRTIVQLLEESFSGDPYSMIMKGIEASQSAIRINCLLKNEKEDEALAHLQKKWQALPIRSAAELAVNGRDLIEWSEKKQGPWMKDVLHELVKRVVEGHVGNTKEEIFREVRKCNLI
ncbi:CCA tRNA nucleotidyltransferase [Bacillus sp. 1P06AnD]|uniref:CCA tRNA nucleotidyltransferase n=1 Tax=Bacillus sp. 1P06AnD TaxID=3132208 RepID=UPI0039A1904D